MHTAISALKKTPSSQALQFPKESSHVNLPKVAPNPEITNTIKNSTPQVFDGNDIGIKSEPVKNAQWDTEKTNPINFAKTVTPSEHKEPTGKELEAAFQAELDEEHIDPSAQPECLEVFEEIFGIKEIKTEEDAKKIG